MTDRRDRERFAKIILALATATRADVDEPTMVLYFRAVGHVPMDLLDQASVELAATAKFFPKPAEWLEAVDELLDRRQRLMAIAGPTNQLALPGEVGEFVCADCDNTGWVTEDRPRTGPHAAAYKDGVGTQGVASRCTNKYCVERKKQLGDRDRRYARSRE